MNPVKKTDVHLARQLILDELFDLSLYTKLRSITGPELQETLDELIVVENRHFAFWQEFFNMRVNTLNLGRNIKLGFLMLVCRLAGAPAVDLVLEAIEVYGVRKYLELWDNYKGEPVAAAVQRILQDEFKHEDEVVTRLKGKKINPDLVRNIFLGLNDGMVEILGAVSGFFASFGENRLVLIAGVTTAVAGSFSMAAGAFVASSSEKEVVRTQSRKAAFLGESAVSSDDGRSSWISAAIIGLSYFTGAVFPLFPVFFGSKQAYPSAITGGIMILSVSIILGFLSGMNIRKRVFTNLVIIAGAAGFTYLIGILARLVWGIHL